MNEKEYQEILKMLQDDAKNQYGYTGPLVGMTEGMSYEDHIDALENQINDLQRSKKVEVYGGNEKAPNNMATMPALPTMGEDKEPIEYNINMLDTTPPMNKKGMMETKQFRDGGSTLDKNIATYGSAIPGFLSAFAEKGAYDTRVGVEKPSMKQMLDFKGAQIGSQFGLPGLVAGAAIDVGKNLLAMKKQARAYNTAKSEADFNQQRNDMQDNREADYTGLSMSGRYGMSTNPYSKYMSGGMVPNYGHGGNAYMGGGMVEYGYGGGPGDPPDTAAKKIYEEGYPTTQAYREALYNQRQGKEQMLNPLIYAQGLSYGYNNPQTGARLTGYLEPLMNTMGLESRAYNPNTGYSIEQQYGNEMPRKKLKYTDQFNRSSPNVPPSGTEKATGLYKRNFRP